MSQQPASKELKTLGLDFDRDNELWLTNGYTLRKIIGVLGMALPILLWLFLRVESNLTGQLPSISHYYFTRAGSIFTIIVSLLAIFLIVYKGPDPVDFYLSATAGLFALCVLLFPTTNLAEACCDSSRKYAVTHLPLSDLSGLRATFHFIAAGLFLLSLAYMSLFLFTKSGAPLAHRGKNKKARNRIYIACGCIMVAAVLFIFIGDFLEAIPEAVFEKHHLTFWMEAVAIEAFGFSWLVKGETILKD